MIYLVIGLIVYVILMTIGNYLERKRIWNKISNLELEYSKITESEPRYVSGDVIQSSKARRM